MMRPSVVAGLALLLVACPKPPETTTPVETAPELPAEDTATPVDDTAVVVEDTSVPEGGQTETVEPAPPAGPTLTEKQRDELVNTSAELLVTLKPEDADKALADLDRVIQAFPDDKKARYNKGLALQVKGDFEAAIAVYDELIALDDTYTPARFAKGVALERLERASLALAVYEEAIEKDPEDMNVRTALISSLRRQDQLSRAEKAAKDALKVNSKSLPIYNELGLVYLEQGQPMKARFVYQKAEAEVEGAAKDAPIRCNLGRSFLDTGEKAVAKVFLEQSRDLDPNYFPMLVYLADIYMDDRNYADALPLLEKATLKEPTNQGVLMSLGLAYRGVGDLDKAKATYEKAMANEPSDPAPHFNLAILLGDYQKDYDASIAAFDKYVELGGKDVERAEEYKEDIEKERKRAEKQRKAAEERARRQREKEERARLLKEAEERAKREAEEAAAAGGTEGELPPDGGSAPEGDAVPEGEMAPDGDASPEGGDVSGTGDAPPADPSMSPPADPSMAPPADPSMAPPAEDASPDPASTEAADPAGEPTEAPAQSGADEAPADDGADASGGDAPNSDAGGEAPAEGEAPADDADAPPEPSPWGEGTDTPPTEEAP